MGSGETKGKSVEAILEELDPKKRAVAERLRSLVKETLPGIVETVKWGNMTYVLNGENLTWIIAYRDHLDLGFFMGARLKSQRLEGTGKGLRHVKVRTLADIDRGEFARLLKDAAKLAS